MEDTSSVIKWDENWNLGIPSIDNQHMYFVGLLNKIYSCFITSAPKEEAIALIDALEEYAQTHFETEERYFKETNYPRLTEHHNKHQELNTKVLELAENYRNGGKEQLMELFDFLENWLVEHLATEDFAYRDYLIEHGIQ